MMKIDFKKTLPSYRARAGRFGKHHEIYLSDPRRTAPDKLRTILRQPVKPESTQLGSL